jgi:pimeloyl-ACP methyl ester carboxylesterase
MPSEWKMIAGETKRGHFDFAATEYTNADERVIAFRGTTKSAGDVAADLKLGFGMNTSHFGQAVAFFDELVKSRKDGRRVIVCGHSLGGAIAQVVANRRDVPFASFNAPGVAIFASRNIDQIATTLITGTAKLRLAGAAYSALRHPMQALEDLASAFNSVTGINVRLTWDVVSKIGVHYGAILTLPGTDVNPVTQHSIDTVVAVLKEQADGKRKI